MCLPMLLSFCNGGQDASLYGEQAALQAQDAACWLCLQTLKRSSKFSVFLAMHNDADESS
jgi:hypothetical protein